VGAVLALVDPALSGQVGGVHDFRVAARSLRAALRTLSRRPDTPLVRKTKRVLRTATRSLADVRDRDVGRTLIAKLRPGPEIDPALKRRATGLSESDRRVALARCAARWPGNLDRLLIDVMKHGEPPVETVIRRTRAEAWRQRRRAIDLIDALGRRYDPVRLHELRRRVRALRYAIEVLAEVDTAAQARVAQIKPLQSALGDAQDRIVLSRWLGSRSVRFRGKDPALSRALRRQAAVFRGQSVQAHTAFLKLKPKTFLEKLLLHVDPAAGPPLAANRP
jgi:CHAD domain-containing protein